MDMNDPREFPTSLFQAAIDAASPAKRIASFLPPRPKGRTIVGGPLRGPPPTAAAVEAV